MIYVWIGVLVIPSPILIFISSEAIAIIASLKGYSPILIASSLALGQTIGFTLLCLFGEQLAQRWERVKRMRENSDLEKYQRHIPKLIAWVSFIGVPPVNICCLAAAAVQYPVIPLIPLLFCGRLLRYWIVASLPEYFTNYVDPNLLPSWLQSL